MLACAHQSTSQAGSTSPTSTLHPRHTQAGKLRDADGQRLLRAGEHHAAALSERDARLAALQASMAEYESVQRAAAAALAAEQGAQKVADQQTAALQQQLEEAQRVAAKLQDEVGSLRHAHEQVKQAAAGAAGRAPAVASAAQELMSLSLLRGVVRQWGEWLEEGERHMMVAAEAAAEAAQRAHHAMQCEAQTAALLARATAQVGINGQWMDGQARGLCVGL